MTLTNLFRLHAVLAAIYALSLVLAPKVVIGLLSNKPLSGVATDITRLFGAALVLIAIVTWTASRMSDTATRRTMQMKPTCDTGRFKVKMLRCLCQDNL